MINLAQETNGKALLHYDMAMFHFKKEEIIVIFQEYPNSKVSYFPMLSAISPIVQCTMHLCTRFTILNLIAPLSLKKSYLW